MWEIAGFVVLGLFTAAVAASMGIGGGVVYVPALVVLFGFEQHVAQGTSLAVIFPTMIVATVAHARMGNVEWGRSIPIGVTGVVGAIVGSRLALHLPADTLRRMFGLLLVALAVRMAWRAWKMGDATPVASPDGTPENPGRIRERGSLRSARNAADPDASPRSPRPPTG